MHVRIVCPEHSAYEGEAAFVALPSTDGELGILPRHASEICTIKSGYVRVCDQRMGEVSRTFAVDGGYAQIADDEVIVLAERRAAGMPVHVEIMVPLVGNHKELRYQKQIIDSTAEQVFSERNDKIEYMVGTMIEVPRAAVTAKRYKRIMYWRI